MNEANRNLYQALGNLCHLTFLSLQEGPNMEEDWYNKSLSALRMNNTHGMLQYQAWIQNYVNQLTY